VKTKTFYQLVDVERDTKRVFYYNKQQGLIKLVEKSGLDVFRARGNDWISFGLDEEIETPLRYEGAMAVESKQTGSHYAVLQNTLPSGEIIDELRVQLHVFNLGLDIDADRDGEVGFGEPGKANWVWGKGHPGAVVMVNNDRDLFNDRPGDKDSELADLLIRPTEVDLTSAGGELVLHASSDDARRFSVYRKDDEGRLQRILGKSPTDDDTRTITVSPPLNPGGEHCYIEAHEYPGPFFEGLLTVELHLLIEQSIFGEDRVVFRVSPWIMTPNTLPVEQVYACDMTTDLAPNSEFLSGLSQACKELQVPLTIIPPNETRSDPTDPFGDRWIQDEIEFGFSQDARHTLPVVCDSPRDRDLDKFPELRLLGPDFGHFQIGSNSNSSLDSFGNLEVSPPVTVRGRHYPMGRIVFGGRAYGDYRKDTRQMMSDLRRFLYAQKVQCPIELYTDWLTVGHVDEIITFVPAETKEGFKTLLASPKKAQAILQGLSEGGFGSKVLFQGKKRRDPEDPKGRRWVSAEITVDELLAQTEFWEINMEFQQCMDQNREILKEELGLEEAQMFAIPVLFHSTAGRAEAYFPDMVNHLVIGPTSIVPKPYGPVIHGKDAFENAFRATVPERDVRFIDDWYSYHQQMGEVHCATNARRTPFPDLRWWENRPEGAYDL
jgi:protein-arginine deiminase